MNKDIAKNGNFTNLMMAAIAAPVVLAWVGLSIFLVVSAFHDPTVVADIESYKSVLLIIGSPALVIIYKVLELWTAQQNSDIEQTRKETFSEEQEHEQSKALHIVKHNIENININSRLQWRFKPMSDVYLVYTDNYDTYFYKHLRISQVCLLKISRGNF